MRVSGQVYRNSYQTPRPGAVRAEVALLHQSPEMLLECVAIAAGQPNRVPHRHASMFPHELDDL